MTEPESIAAAALSILGKNGDLQGKKILVSAGPTREWIDPVRFISNRSSGKMGYGSLRLQLNAERMSRLFPARST